MVIHKTVGYTDNALRSFFAVAKKQPWYDNTIFVITNDHTNMRGYDEYRSDIGAFYGPVLIFDPSGDIAPGKREGIVQQIDIMPTMLNYLGYDKPYIAFGCDILNTPESEQWAVNYTNGIFQYVKGAYVLQFDGQHPIALYAITDHLQSHNLLPTEASPSAATSSASAASASASAASASAPAASASAPAPSASEAAAIASSMERELKAIIQSYMDRMLNDRLTTD